MTGAVILVPLFPLAGVLANLLLGRRLGRRAVSVLACGSVGASFAAALAATASLMIRPEGQRSVETVLYKWIGSGALSVPLGFLLDPLSAVMILVVTGVGFLIHVYSVGYMHHDEGHRRYFLFLNLFIFAMLLLVLGNSYLTLFVGWEGVGLCSYLLIGFWFKKDSANRAGMKAFIVNRVGDAGFLLGMFLLFNRLETLTFTEVFTRAPEVFPHGGAAVTLITLLLFVGAMGKSAQFPLHVWLPDAMEGPTPVSALIHAATMVTAGVYMVCRSHVLFDLAPLSLTVVAVAGLFTAFFAATIALTQNDIKRVLAYSTVSQLGFMFLAAGVGAYTAAIFHLVTHAFFKALLFLGSGSVIHALAGEQDIRNMGGLRGRMPVTYRTFLLGAAAIAGIPPLAGFMSKDEILFSAFSVGEARAGVLFWLAGIVTAFMTAFYMFRLVYKTFHGPEGEAVRHAHESPPSMALPLVVLAGLSAVGGFLGVPVLPQAKVLHHWLGPLFGAGEGAERLVAGLHGVGLELILMGVSVLVAVAGIVLALNIVLRRPEVSAALAHDYDALYDFLLHKWRIDELYHAAVVRPLAAVARFCWSIIDAAGIDGAVNGLAFLFGRAGASVRRLQTGFTENYALSMTVGVFLILLFAFFLGVRP